MLMIVQTGEDRGSRRLANRTLAVGTAETHSFICHTVQVRSFDHGVAGTAHGVVTMLVRVKINDIGFLT